MTTQQLYLFGMLYLALSLILAFFLRPTARRVLGALVGGAVGSVAALGIIALGEKVGWWHFTISWTPYFLTLFYLGTVISCVPIFLITWRITRRFDSRGLVVFLIFLAIIGPPRDKAYLKLFPQWGTHAPGVATILAISASYVLIVGLGHWAMVLVAGPSTEDRLARRPWEPAGLPHNEGSV